MKRSEFIAGVAADAFAASSASAVANEGPFAAPEPQIERAQSGKPHAGKVLAAIQPHADDLHIFAGGPLLKLMREGYTGYLNTAQGPAGQNGAQLRRRLAGQGLRLPLPGGDDQTANREYVREFVPARDAAIGRKFGLTYAEAYHYIGPEPATVEDYVRKNAVRL